MNIAENAIKESSTPVAVFSIEMSKEQLHMRLITSESRINSTYIKTGQVPKEKWARVLYSVGEIHEWPLYINDNPNITCGGIRRAARNLKRKHNIGLIIVDYIQLIRTPDVRSRHLEVAAISRNLKALAKELDIPVIALSQLNRKVEDRGEKKPVLSDLRESGSLEQDADIIMFIYRDEVYNQDENNPKRGMAELSVAKQRNGPTGVIDLVWLGHHVRFENPTYGG
jgi:replicative DNA helicase